MSKPVGKSSVNFICILVVTQCVHNKSYKTIVATCEGLSLTTPRPATALCMQSPLASAGDTFGARSVTHSPSLSNSTLDVVADTSEIFSKIWHQSGFLSVICQLSLLTTVSNACLSSFGAAIISFPGNLPSYLSGNDHRFSFTGLHFS